MFKTKYDMSLDAYESILNGSKTALPDGCATLAEIATKGNKRQQDRALYFRLNMPHLLEELPPEPKKNVMSNTKGLKAKKDAEITGSIS